MTATPDFERILASEGLAPLDRPSEANGGPRVLVRHDFSGRGPAHLRYSLITATMVRRQEVADSARAEMVALWTAWALDVLKRHRFVSSHQRSVWRLYAKGTTLTKIMGELGLSRRSVTRALERVRRQAPSPPCDNPWLKGPCRRPDWEARVRGLLFRLDRRKVVGLCSQALRCADKDRLREMFGDDEGLLALVPPDEAKEIAMAEAKRVMYDRINLKRGCDIDTPWALAGARQRDHFVNVEGRPHAGGIDIEIEAKGGVLKTVTLPWDIVAQADRSASAE